MPLIVFLTFQYFMSFERFFGNIRNMVLQGYMTLFRVLTCLKTQTPKTQKKLVRLWALWKNQTQDFLSFVDGGAGGGDGTELYLSHGL